ncbi:MAG: hypothetical protein HWD61_07930 [Parachlamydiaceae bacterium]|nr:MAG: hypothetical protein HWD61_07930 [Parachlamydiaceae bacterium]
MEPSLDALKNYSDKQFLLLDQKKQSLKLVKRDQFSWFSKWRIKLGFHSSSLKKVAAFINQQFDALKHAFGHQPGKYWNLLDDSFNPFGYEIIHAYSHYLSFHNNSHQVRKLARNFMIHCVDPNLAGVERENLVQAHRNITKIFKSLAYSRECLIYADKKRDLHRVNSWNLFGRIKVACKEKQTQRVIEKLAVK